LGKGCQGKIHGYCCGLRALSMLMVCSSCNRPVGKQGKYVGRRKNVTKKKNWSNYKINIKEID
jgi:hypothetical protein